MQGCWPSQVSPVELNYDTEGIEEFQVTLQVQYWEAYKGADGQGAPSVV